MTRVSWASSYFQQGQRLTCQWCSWAEFCPASTQSAPGPKGRKTSRAFWVREMASTWSPCPYHSSSLPWPHTLDCSTHTACALLRMLAEGCTWDGTAEGQQAPHHQLQQGWAISHPPSASAKNMDFAGGEGKRQGWSDPASRDERKTNKVRGRQGILGNHKHLI